MMIDGDDGRKPLFGEVVEALDGVWHPDCFTCNKCNKKLADCAYSNLKGTDDDNGGGDHEQESLFVRLVLKLLEREIRLKW